MRFNQSTAIEQIQGDFYGRNVSITISFGRRFCRGLESLRFVILRNRVLDICKPQEGRIKCEGAEDARANFQLRFLSVKLAIPLRKVPQATR